MSLYIVGVLFQTRHETVDLRSVLNDVSQRNELNVNYEIDLDDLAIFSEVFDSLDDFVPFMLTDNASCSDVTSSWIEATSAARASISGYDMDVTTITAEEIQRYTFPDSYFESMKHTRLGQFLLEILLSAGIENGAIWIADGGPDGVIQLRAAECLHEIFKTMILPWDRLPNLAYAWEN
jgi:hypothetical protein